MRIAINCAKVDGPFGGANRFATNLETGLEAAGHYVTRALEPDLDVIIIVISHDGLRLVAFSPADIAAYKKAYPNVMVVQRVNGSDEHRGYDNGTNKRLLEANQCADHTIFVSDFMRTFWAERGINKPEDCTVIKTGADEEVFHDKGHEPHTPGTPVKFITHHWSANYMKGFDIYERLDQMLVMPKWKDRIEFTFIGNTPLGYDLKNAKCLPPMDGDALADILREHDAYVTASRYEAGGNHYIEALQCGLPVLHLDHGSSPEYCKEFGVTFQLSDFEEKLEEFLESLAILEAKTQTCTYSDSSMSQAYVSTVENLVKQHKKTSASNQPFKFTVYKWQKKLTNLRRRIANRLAR